MSAQFILRLLSSYYPSTYPKPTPGHYVVLWGQHVVGSIYQHEGGPQQRRWHWAISWPASGQALERGVVDSLAEAQAAFRVGWDRWAKRNNLPNDPADPANDIWPKPVGRRA